MAVRNPRDVNVSGGGGKRGSSLPSLGVTTGTPDLEGGARRTRARTGGARGEEGADSDDEGREEAEDLPTTASKSSRRPPPRAGRDESGQPLAKRAKAGDTPPLPLKSVGRVEAESIKPKNTIAGMFGRVMAAPSHGQE